MLKTTIAKPWRIAAATRNGDRVVTDRREADEEQRRAPQHPDGDRRRADPERFETRIAVNAAANEPRAPIEKTIPITAADSSSSRTAKTRKTANATLEKKLEVAVAAGLRAQVRVAEDEAQAFLQLGPETRLAPIGCLPRRRLLLLADAQEEQPRAQEADRVHQHRVRRREDLDERSRQPWPPSWAAERLISSFELPSMIWSRSTSEGRYDWYATSKKTWQIPVRKTTT